MRSVMIPTIMERTNHRTATGLPDARTAVRFPYRTIALGIVGSVVVMLASFGAGGTVLDDPVFGDGPLSWIRYGHGKWLVGGTLYLGCALLVWSWVRLGRYVLRGVAGNRAVVTAAWCWAGPLVVAAPLFTRDVFSYLGQGAQLLHGLDPYASGPATLRVLDDLVQNVHPLWQTTPAPYGPLFLLLAKGVVALTGNHLLLGVIVTRTAVLPGLGMVLWALPRLARDLAGDPPVTMWLVVASPMMVVHLIGGPHNDLLMLGALSTGVLAALRGRHVLAVSLVTVGMLIKPTAALALPFLVWMWANRLAVRKPVVRFLAAGGMAVAVFVVVFIGGTLLAFGSLNLGWLTGLRAPTMIVNWLHVPSGIGQLAHGMVELVVDIDDTPFVVVCRVVAGVILVAFVARQWWLARHGGGEAVYRMALTLLVAALLAPPTLPWYFTWGLVLAAAFRWRVRQLRIAAGVSVFLVLAYYPTGEQAVYDWWYMAGVLVVSCYVAACVRRPDPVGLLAAWSRPGRMVGDTAGRPPASEDDVR